MASERKKLKLGKAQLDAWQTVQRGHAIANGMYVAAVNRIGLEKPFPDSPGIEFWGSSFIADPQGVIFAEASADKEENLDCFGGSKASRRYQAQLAVSPRTGEWIKYDGIKQRFLSEEEWKKK